MMDKVKIAVVQIQNAVSSEYDFFTDITDLQEDDLVVISTSAGWRLGIVKMLKRRSSKATRWVVCKVDTQEFLLKQAMRDKQKEIISAMERRRKEIESIEVYERLAGVDPTMADLLRQLREATAIDVSKQKIALEELHEVKEEPEKPRRPQWDDNEQ